MTLLIVVVLLVLMIVALERDRVRDGVRALLLLVTGGVLIAPMREALAGVIAPLARFIRSALEYGDSVSAPSPQVETRSTAAAPQETTGGESAQTTTPVPGLSVATPVGPTPTGNYHLHRVLADLVLTALTVVFVWFDYEFIGLTFEALFGFRAAPATGVGQTMLTSLALMASMVLWGLIGLEAYGYTHFMREFPAGLRRRLKAMTLAALVIGLSSTVVMGMWRARAMDDGPLEFLDAPVATSTGVIAADAAPGLLLLDEPSGFDAFAPMYLSAAIPSLVLVSSAISFTGVLSLAKYIALFGLGLAWLSLAVLYFWVLPTFDNALAHLVHGAETLIDLVASIGQRIVDTVSPPFEAMRAATHRKVHTWTGGSTPVAATAAAPAAATAANPAATATDRRDPVEGTETTQDAQPARDLNWQF